MSELTPMSRDEFEPQWDDLENDQVRIIAAFGSGKNIILYWEGEFLLWCCQAEPVVDFECLPLDDWPEEPEEGVWVLEAEVHSREYQPPYATIGYEVDYWLTGEWRPPTPDEYKCFIHFTEEDDDRESDDES